MSTRSEDDARIRRIVKETELQWLPDGPAYRDLLPDGITLGPLKPSARVLARRMRNPYFHPHENRCGIAEHPDTPICTMQTEHGLQKPLPGNAHLYNDNEKQGIVGTPVNETHANWVTAYNMLTGIRHAVSRVNAKNDRDLIPSDYNARYKTTHDKDGNELTPSAKYEFKFKDYAPWVFKTLRKNFRIDSAEYLLSLTKEYVLTELGSPGKSGSFFYYSRDLKYIIKTISQSEAKVLQSILPAYTEYVEDNPNTLLSQYYGLHRVKLPYGRKIHFVVMNNLFPAHRDIHYRYDLKGSLVGREVPEAKLKAGGYSVTTRKDVNWLNEKMELKFGQTKNATFQGQLSRDTEFLAKHSLMDYSLLIGVHDLSIGNRHGLRGKTYKTYQPDRDVAFTDYGLYGTRISMQTETHMEGTRREQATARDLDQYAAFQYDDQTFCHYFHTDDGGFRATNAIDQPMNGIYYIGVIDCLTKWSIKKKAESFFKGLAHNSSNISPINPVSYRERLLRFMKRATPHNHESNHHQHNKFMELHADDERNRRQALWRRFG